MPPQRNTRQRAAIQSAFTRAPRPLSPREVYELAREAVPNLGIATVYRALGEMVQEGALRVVELPGQNSRYELSGLGHHHHFHCTRCDRVYDLQGCLLKTELKLPKGFELQHHDITLSGTCPDCGRAKT